MDEAIAEWRASGLSKGLATCILSGLFILAADSSVAKSISDVAETRRAYDLSEQNGQTPVRALRFWIGRNRAFAICGKCLCLTGVATAEYPQLGLFGTSGSPTHACEPGSEDFQSDIREASTFMGMQRVEANDANLVFSDGQGNAMVFLSSDAPLLPPE